MVVKVIINRLDFIKFTIYLETVSFQEYQNKKEKLMIQNIIFYFSYLSIPFFLLLIILFFKYKKQLLNKKIILLLVIFGFIITSTFIYSRFIERNIILTQVTKVKVGFSSKLIVISDIHLGVYKSTSFLKRVVDKINKIKNADAVLIPGDFIYYPSKDLDKLFSVLEEIKFPIYAVLGNHDSERPGPPIQKKLQKTLENFGITFLHNSSSMLVNKNITILGLGDKWSSQDDISKIEKFKKTENLIIITHNPDTVLNYKNSIPDLTVTGHTHGGQIRIPFIYKSMIPCTGDFDQGLYKTKNGKVYVSSGIGEIGLPMRLGIPPVIDILELY